mmetsp:Transcript_7843/g.24706  ORF Transcript_7843/g.24706 Transcript_7843/m.24706 type:complete len:386 (+) Transcript_7843:385-1542(+)
MRHRCVHGRGREVQELGVLRPRVERAVKKVARGVVARRGLERRARAPRERLVLVEFFQHVEDGHEPVALRPLDGRRDDREQRDHDLRVLGFVELQRVARGVDRRARREPIEDLGRARSRDAPRGTKVAAGGARDVGRHEKVVPTLGERREELERLGPRLGLYGAEEDPPRERIVEVLRLDDGRVAEKERRALDSRVRVGVAHDERCRLRLERLAEARRHEPAFGLERRGERAADLDHGAARGPRERVALRVERIAVVAARARVRRLELGVALFRAVVGRGAARRGAVVPDPEVIEQRKADVPFLRECFLAVEDAEGTRLERALVPRDLGDDAPRDLLCREGLDDVPDDRHRRVLNLGLAGQERRELVGASSRLEAVVAVAAWRLG